MKPILFNTESVKAILDGRKSVTRRVVRLRYYNTHLELEKGKYGTQLVELQNGEHVATVIQNPDGTTIHSSPITMVKLPPYYPSNILYVQETFAHILGRYVYQADCQEVTKELKTLLQSPINMPKEAARLFLQVTDVRVERLQGITPEQLRAEGVEIFLLPSECQRMFNRFGAIRDFDEKKKEFAKLWDSAIKKADLPLYGWDANPWVWVIEFNRISKEEAIK